MKTSATLPKQTDSAGQRTARAAARKLRRAGRALIQYKYLYMLLIPFLLWYVLFMVRPLYFLQIAFKDYSLFKGVAESPWCGFKHFTDFFQSPYFGRLLSNTLIINIYGIVFGFTTPIILALMLNEVRKVWFKKAVQTITYIPYFISVVVVAGMVNTMLSPNTGVVNLILEKLGGQSVYFMTKKEWFRAIYTIMNIWIQTGFGTVVYIAALSSIDQQLYEACVIDGGGKWRQLLHITIPGILPTIMTMLIMKIGSLLDVGYESIILLYQPVTYETADVINTYVYRMGIEKGKYDISVAIGLFNSVIALILVMSANKLSNKMTNTGLW